MWMKQLQNNRDRFPPLKTYPVEKTGNLFGEVWDVNWPEQVRGYVSGHGECVGLLAKSETTQKDAKLEPMILEPESEMASVIQQANRVIGQWCDKHAPEGFGWTSLQVNVNSVADWHVDHRNMGPSCVMVLGAMLVESWR